MKNRTASRGVVLLGFLTLLNVVNFVDRMLAPSLGFQIERDIHMGHEQLGLLTGYAFVVFYTCVGVVLGTAADRWSRSRLIALGLVLWSAATAASGLARSFGHMAAARMLLGVGEAALTPAAVSMLSDVFPAKRRALAGGIYYTGIPLGGGLSLIVSAWLEPKLGWRSCFYLLGLVGLALVLPAWRMKDPKRGAMDRQSNPSAPGREGDSSVRAILAQLARALGWSPALALTILGSVAVIFTAASANLTLVWLQKERGFPISVGYQAGVICLMGGVAGNVAGGWLADLCHKRWVGGRLWFLGWAQLAYPCLAIAFYTAAAGSPLFYAAWFGSAFGAALLYGPILASVQDLAPAEIRSTALAFLIFAQNFLGVGLGPWLAGRIGDAASLTRGLVVAACVGFLAVPLLLAAAWRYGADRGHVANAECGMRNGE